jgi:isocitrate lyase
VAQKLQGEDFELWHAKCYSMSLTELQEFSKQLGVGDVYFDWEQARSVEGYYRIAGCTKFCSQRAKAFAPYCDAVWMETAKPGLKQAKEFRDDVLSVHPHLMLAYNNSPSFNWDAAGMTDEEMRTFIPDLAQMGYCWQFITLAGFHQDALGISLFARAYKTDGMKAYVQNIQRQEREHDVSTLLHQKWSGSELIDAYLKTVTGGRTSTAIMGAGVTEDQFRIGVGSKQVEIPFQEAPLAPLATSSSKL